MNEKKELRVAKISTLSLGIVAIVLGILFKGQNIAFMVGLAFAIASSANFPALLLSIYWKKFTTQGAVASMITGLGLAIILIFLSPTIWVDVLHHSRALFPLKNPGLFSMAGSFLVGILVSRFTHDLQAEEKYDEETVRSCIGEK